MHIEPDYVCEYDHSTIQNNLLSAAPLTIFGLYHTVGEKAEAMINLDWWQCVSSKILTKPYRNGCIEKSYYNQMFNFSHDSLSGFGLKPLQNLPFSFDTYFMSPM